MKEIRESLVVENEGQKIFAVVHTPVGSLRAPAVLMCHGFGGTKSGTHRLYLELASLLSAKGIVVLRFDFRGSGDSEGKFSESSISTQVSDARLMLRTLSELPQVDSSSLGMFGSSLGGAIATLTASEHPSIRALGLWAPVYDGSEWREKWAKTAVEDKSKEIVFNGRRVNKMFLRELFTIDMAAALEKLSSVPLFHIHSEADKIVPISHAERYEQQRQGKVDSKFIRFSRSPHHFSDFEEQERALAETSEWFAEKLGLIDGGE